MIDKLPISVYPDNSQVVKPAPIAVLARLDDIIVLQTAAFSKASLSSAAVAATATISDADADADAGNNSNAIDDANSLDAKNDQHMLAEGQSSYAALNLGLHVQDNAEQVLQNRMRLLSAINGQLASTHQPIKALHWVNQVHGEQVHDIDATMLTMQPVDADAMVSYQDNIGLAIMTADCVPIVLYQPTTGQIAAIHAGWQGLACGVIKATAKSFDLSAPIMAWIGVCISQQHYQVNAEVAERLLTGCVDNRLLAPEAIDNFQSWFCKCVDTDTDTDTDTDANNWAGKLNLDLPKIAAAQLQLLNISVANELPVACSYDDSRYYSYRRQTHRQQPATGRMALIIARSDPIKS